MNERARQTAWVWATSTAAAVVLAATLVACGGGSGSHANATARRAEDLVMQPADFHNINTMTKVRGFFVDNRLGHLDQALKVANSPTGGV
jgi:hypothetical protein